MPDILTAFVINLERDVARREFIQVQLAKFPILNPVFVPAINGSTLPDSVCEMLSGSVFWARFKGSIGCFLSHVKAWELVAQGTSAFAAIFEDDADLIDLESIFSTDLPEDFDIIYVNERMLPKERGHPDAIISVGEALRLRDGSKPGFGADGYLLTVAGAKKLLLACKTDLYFGHVDNRLVRYATSAADVDKLDQKSMVARVLRHHHNKDRMPAFGLLKGYVKTIPLVKHRGLVSSRAAMDDAFLAKEKTPDMKRLIIEINPLGNFANRAIQYLAAKKLAMMFPSSIILNPNLPELAFPIHDEPASEQDPTLHLLPGKIKNFVELVDLVKSRKYARVVIADYMQKMDLLPDKNASSEILRSEASFTVFADNELVINIRAAELAAGIDHYPLIPIDFYKLVISLTGLDPVFMGQIDQSAYCKTLQATFPNARFVKSGGPLHDFQSIRHAKNIVIAASTFSWLAAWLSNARSIFVPVIGLLNPIHFRDRRIDLLPRNDPRYRYFKFPLHFGVPEDQAMRLHPALTGFCREVSAETLEHLKSPPPPAPFLAEDFDEIWYTHSHLDAAAEISEGWFAGPAEHYLSVGRRHYLPLPQGFSYQLPNIDRFLVDHAFGKQATQSSITEDSVGRTVEEDAARALVGPLDEVYAFHTGNHGEPWWQVDLGGERPIKHIAIVNRFNKDRLPENAIMAGRATPLSAETSLDGMNWTELFTTPDGFIFGRDGRTLVWTGEQIFTARFLRLSVRRRTWFHLRQVQVFGPPAGQPAHVTASHPATK